MENENEEIKIQDPLLIKKRKIIKKFFPEIPNQITKEFKDIDIVQILKNYKNNIKESKLKKN